jgi:hypothetical protein
MSRAGALTAVVVTAALLSLAATFFVTVYSDREGGVTLLLVRPKPEWPSDSGGTSPSEFGYTVVRGNENGVYGEGATRWNARYGVWLLSALAAMRLYQHAKARR